MSRTSAESLPDARRVLERHRPAGSAPSRARDHTGDNDEGIGDDDGAEDSREAAGDLEVDAPKSMEVPTSW